MKQNARKLEGEFDYIIVGAGTAGCVLANRLTEDPDVTVLLLEAGGKDDYHWIHVPVGYLYCIGNPRTDWLYKTQAEPGLNGRALSYPRGRVLGGCSSINGMIYMRGQREDYDDWAHITGDPNWSWDSVLPVFRRSEDHHGGANEWHGAGGEWRVEKQRLKWKILETFSQAAQQTGIRATDDFNRGDNAGVGYFDVNQKSGIRWNASKAFLRAAMKRPNLTTITGAHTQRLVFEGKRCVGVEYRGGDIDYLAKARSEVILSAGAVNSPQILELSGIGNGARLQRLGIDVVRDLRGVGENLQDHLQLRMAYKVNGVRTLNTLSAHWWGKLFIGLQYALMRSGPMSMAPSQLGAFAKSNPDDASITRPDLEYHVQPLSLDRFGEPLHRVQCVHGIGVSVAADLARQRAYRIARCARGAADRAELSVDGTRPRGRRQRDAAHAPHRRGAGARALRAAGDPAGRRIPDRRGTRAGGGQYRHDDLPSGRHVPHGHGQRSRRRGRQPAARHRPARAAHRRCIGHADHHVGQHQLADADDRGTRERDDSRGSTQYRTAGSDRDGAA